MKKIVVGVMMAALTLAAGAALAECNEDQEASTGKHAAEAARDKVNPVVAVQGKQMVSVTSCEPRGVNVIVEFKYNFIGADGYYWLESRATLNPVGKPIAFKVLRVSPNLQAVASKSAEGAALLAAQ